MSTGIFTQNELRRLGRRLDRRGTSINVALTAMRRGELLCLEYRAGKPHWLLSNGAAVHADIANILISNALIIPASGALFDCVPAQTWRYIE
jgi:hypothetical protein